jgi:citrate lyase gamma subunit
MNPRRSISRRQFIKSASAAAIGTTLLLSGQEPTAPAKSGLSRVVLLRDLNVLDENGKPRYAVVEEMLDKGIVALTGKPDPQSAWKTIIRPDDIVGIKNNCWQYLRTTAEVENSIKKRIMEVGVKEADISVDDRGVLQNPIFQKATALINARPMRSHHWSGVGSLIKNYIMFIPEPITIHPDSCADLASIWDLPVVKGKTRLNVLVMFTPQFHSFGPHSFNPKYVWKYHGLMLGFDPVAVDATGLRIIEGIRREFFAEDRPLNPPAKHIAIADSKFHLGTADPQKIELVKIGYDKESFV